MATEGTFAALRSLIWLDDNARERHGAYHIVITADATGHYTASLIYGEGGANSGSDQVSGTSLEDVVTKLADRRGIYGGG